MKMKTLISLLDTRSGIKDKPREYGDGQGLRPLFNNAQESKNIRLTTRGSSWHREMTEVSITSSLEFHFCL